MPHSALNKELGRFRPWSLLVAAPVARAVSCGNCGFRACSAVIETEIVTSVTVCVELLSRFSDSFVQASKGDD